MGLFRKKPDPISERAKMLNDQIAAIEAQIQRLSDRAEEAPNPSNPSNPSNLSNPPNANGHGQPAPAPAPAPKSGGPQPRLRSTALPHHQHQVAATAAASATPAPASQEPVFEEVAQSRWDGQDPQADPGPSPELGVRRHDAASVWQRFKNHVRGPVTSNPKLVHYLSAGSIQGLRPLRYEKRVARNRVIVLAAFLVLALWGVIAIFVSRR